MELCVCESLHQAVCIHLVAWNVLEVDSPSCYFVTDVDVFCLGVIDWVVGKSNKALIITFERDGAFGHVCQRLGGVRSHVGFGFGRMMMKRIHVGRAVDALKG